MERRKRDLNPRAGFPAYTLSRGASSASWVFLRIDIFHMIASFDMFVLRRIDHYTRLILHCQGLFRDIFIYFFLYFVVHKMCYFRGLHSHILIRHNGFHVVDFHKFLLQWIHIKGAEGINQGNRNNGAAGFYRTFECPALKIQNLVSFPAAVSFRKYNKVPALFYHSCHFP